MWLCILLLIPLFWPWISRFFWPHKITVKEVLINIGIVSTITVVTYAFAMIGASIDTEIWNGYVTDKHSEHVSCEHSYQCNCRTVTTGYGKNKTTQTVCDTCYEHAFDVDWVVESNIGDEVTIDRVDRQGLLEPPRWTKVTIGEPFSHEHTFRNYIKSNPDSLFNNKDLVEKYKDILPNYPEVYDYYRINRVITVGITVPSKNEWNIGLSEILKTLGKKKKCNIVMVITNAGDREYANALKEHWLGGKKNDLIIVVGCTKYPNIDWVEVFSWSKDKILEVEIRDGLQELTLEEVDKGVKLIQKEVNKHFNKIDMEEYKYLTEQNIPPTWVILTTVIISLIASAGVTYLAYKEDF